MTDAGQRLVVNGRDVVIDVAEDTPLLYVLRNDLDLKGVRPGCGIGECGACTVVADGHPIRSCITPLSEVAGAQVVTPEGLGTPERPHPVQQAFLDEQAAQCGYCINGMIMTTAALAADATLSDTDVAAALDHHLCRCGTHVRILRAVRRSRTPEKGVAASPERVEDRQPDAAACSDSCTAAVRSPSLETAPSAEDWLRVLPDGRVEARTGKVEIGQGIRTAFAQIVARQLDMASECVVVRSATTEAGPDEGYTAGSLSLENGGTALAAAAAALRRLLLARASRQLGEPVDVLAVSGGAVSAPDGVRVTFAELAAQGPITGRIELSDRPHWHGAEIGSAVSRDDLVPKLTGAGAYVHDVSLPGMLHARALLPPTYDARLESVDLDSARGLPGVRTIVADGRLLIAIAEREEQAVQAVRRLEQSARWENPELDLRGDVIETLRTLPAETLDVRRDVGVDAALEGGVRRVRATYSKPYQAHGPMAPSCAVAVVEADVLTVWTHSQGVHPLRRELATLLGEDESRVLVHHGDGPGCYGHNGADDAAGFAAVAAQAVPGAPVRFQLSGSDEFAWDPFGSAMVADLEAVLDGSGQLTGWRHRSRTDVHATRPTGAGDRLSVAWLGSDARQRPVSGPHATGSRNIVPIYDLPAIDVATDFVRGPLRTSALRSLASFHNIFAIESFMDELAEAAGQDPIAFRLAHLSDDRARRVLEVAAEAAGWEPHVGPSGRGQGVAVARYKGDKAYVAQVVSAGVDTDTGRIWIDRVVVACDAGVVINPDGLRNQLEGGVLQGLSRTLHEEVRVSRRGIESRDWTTYPVLGFADVPQVDVVLVDRPGLPPLGAGEAATPPVPAAVASAVDDAVGIRLRDLPFTPERVRQRLFDLDETEMARVRLD